MAGPSSTKCAVLAGRDSLCPISFPDTVHLEFGDAPTATALSAIFMNQNGAPPGRDLPKQLCHFTVTFGFARNWCNLFHDADQRQVFSLSEGSDVKVPAKLDLRCATPET